MSAAVSTARADRRALCAAARCRRDHLPRARRGLSRADRRARRRGGELCAHPRRAGSGRGRAVRSGRPDRPAGRADRPQGHPRHPGRGDHGGFADSCRATCPCTTRARSRAYARPAWCRWARPTWTSSQWDRRPSTRPTGPPTIRGTPAACRAAPAAVRQRRSRRDSRRLRWAPTPAARSASPQRCAAWSGSSRPTARCRGTA